MEWKDFTSLGMFSFAIAATLLTAGGLVYALRGVISDVREIQTQLDTQKDALHRHVSDKEEHVNRLHMAALKESIDKNEKHYELINQKLDRIAEKIYSSK